MAYKRTTKKKNDWKEVKGMAGFTVIGSPERFSISFTPTDDFRIGMNGLRVIEGKNGSFISFPAWKDSEGNYHDHCYMTFSDDEIGAIIEALES